MRSRTRHVDMPWGQRAVHMAMTLLTAGLWLPLWLHAEKVYRREHTVTEYED